MSLSKKWLRWLIWLTLVIVITFFIIRSYMRSNDNFHISSTSNNMSNHPTWEISPLSEPDQQLLDKILDQPFQYIGKGTQSYVFKSNDEKYVVKLFKFKHMKSSWILEFLPEWEFMKEYREKNLEKKNALVVELFSGYKLGYEELKGDTGLIYLHLNKTKNFDRKLNAYDKMGTKWDIDLNPISFVVQENVTTTQKILNEAFKKNDLALAKKRISQIFELYLREYSKGIYDFDHGVFDNTGFIGEKAVHIDLGRLKKDEKMKLPEYYKQDLIILANKYNVRFKRNYPKQYPEMKVFLEQEMTKLLGEPFKYE
jgi:hypothetical protein